MFIKYVTPITLTREKYSCIPSDNIQQKMDRVKKWRNTASTVQLVCKKKFSSLGVKESRILGPLKWKNKQTNKKTSKLTAIWFNIKRKKSGLFCLLCEKNLLGYWLVQQYRLYVRRTSVILNFVANVSKEKGRDGTEHKLTSTRRKRDTRKKLESKLSLPSFSLPCVPLAFAPSRFSLPPLRWLKGPQ